MNLLKEENSMIFLKSAQNVFDKIQPLFLKKFLSKLGTNRSYFI